MFMSNLLMWLAIGGIVCVPAALTVGFLVLELFVPWDRWQKVGDALLALMIASITFGGVCGTIAVLFLLP